MAYHAQGKIGCNLASREVVLTSTGAQTTPFPKVNLTTNQKVQNTVTNVDAWHFTKENCKKTHMCRILQLRLTY